MHEIEWVDDRRLRVRGVEFISWVGTNEQTSAWVVGKAAQLLDEYRRALVAPIPNIVEVGIYGGGSTALLALLCQPRRLVSLELSTRPIDALKRFIADHGLQDVVRPHVGIDQADRARVAAVLRDEFGDEPLDLVIDDASHQLEPTRATFEELFPRLRPGGRYIIEDWSGDTRLIHRLHTDLADPSAPGHEAVAARVRAAAADRDHPDHQLATRLATSAGGHVGPPTGPGAPARTAPLARLALELVLAKAVRRPGIGKVEVSDYWVVVTREDAPLDSDSFHIDAPDLDPGVLLRPLG